MLHWRQSYFETLRSLRDQASQIPDWEDYSSFCGESENGLRELAFATLNRFISKFESWPFPKRRQFVSWLLHAVDGRDGREAALPHPLRLSIVEPTLSEWILEEPNCAEPHRWIGGDEHLQRALELDPRDQIARRDLALCILGRIGTAELPERYIGSPHEDLEGLVYAEELLRGIESDNLRLQLTRIVEEERNLILAYLRRNRS
jgi:hypothetical protein